MAWNYFDYVDNSEIWLKDFVMATTLIRKSETWKKKDNMFSICGLDILNDKLFCLILSDLDECINASRCIYKELHEHENIVVTVLDAEELDVTNLLHDSEINIVNDTNEFVSSYIHDYLGG